MFTSFINVTDGLLRFLYMMIICMDANFRLKNQIVSNYSQDPGLGIGWAYMVPRLPYEMYVLSRANDIDVSFAHNHHVFTLTTFSRLAPVWASRPF